MKIFSFYLIALSLISLINPTNSFSFTELLEISKHLNSMSIDPLKLLFSLTKMRLETMDEDFSCTLCQRLVKAITSSIIDKYSYDSIEYYAELLCSVALDREVCHNYIKEYGETAIDSFILRLANEQNFCHSLGFCFEGEETEDSYDYAIRVLKGKPDKEKEPIDYTAPKLRMLQVNDIHLDINYIANGSVFCDEPVCCRKPASNFSRIKSGKFGYVGRCDANLDLIDSFVEKAYELKPDFIIWAGDNSPHNLKNASQKDNYDATIIIRDKLDEKFNYTIPIYPALGNHEIYPVDLFITNKLEFLEEYANIFKKYFYEDQAYESFKKYGYYSEKYKDTNLRIVVLNCLVCDNFNFYIMGGRHQPAKDQFIWLEKVLRQAEKDGEYIYIVNHFPINDSFESTECAQRLRALIERFNYLIRGIFSGHSHLDDISPVKTFFEPKPIININYVAPPLGTYPGRHPAFRIYSIDSNSKNIIDYEQYRLNITDANLKGKAEWYITYNATNLFNVTDLSQLDKIFKINVDGDYLIYRYGEGTDAKKLLHNKKEIDKAQCHISTDTFHDYYNCVDNKIFSGDFFFEILNSLSGEWALKDVD